jgi:D-alanyl-D-alanine carboxypeptidase/D-alanyl-D-alanine-endopeptidase (penicillin-binding protein 4)
VGLLLLGFTAGSDAKGFQDISALIGSKDSIAVADPQGQILFAKNENAKLIPASILKLFTALVAQHYLGPEYRFATEFYLDSGANLKIKGYGDPLLISEVVAEISRNLAAKLNTSQKLNDLVLDSSYFDQPLTIPGITSSSEPYDAPNGALCVNFNTVYFKNTENGYVSAEAQTPLLPFAMRKIKASKMDQGRIVGKVNKNNDHLILRHVSRYSVKQIISKMLEYSNNFTTNQLFITAGIKAFSPPGTLNKGVSAALTYAVDVLKLEGMTIFEGSGISRSNRVSATHMIKILNNFASHHYLMRRQNNDFYKTGTLSGINTRAGYIRNKNGQLFRYVVIIFRYVVIINTPGKSTHPVMNKLTRILD